MRGYYNQLTFWQNKTRRNLLWSYLKYLQIYFDAIVYDDLLGDSHETKASQNARTWLNRHIGQVNKAIQYALVSPNITHYPAPIIGGPIQNIDIVENFALIHLYRIPPTQVYDVLEKAIGIYEADYQNSIIRTFSPFFWLSLLLEWIGSSPFKLLAKLGVPKTKQLENSFPGRLVKLIIQAMILFGGIWQAFVFVGVIPQTASLKGFISQIFK